MKELLMKIIKSKEFFFIIKFFVIFGILSLILEIIQFTWLQEFLATIIGNALNLKVIGTQIITKASIFNINNFCTGLMSASIYLSIVFAFRKPELKIKALIAVTGILLLFLVNILRVYFVIFVGINSFQLAEILHILTWFIMSGAIITFWYWLTKKITKKEDLEDLM